MVSGLIGPPVPQSTILKVFTRLVYYPQSQIKVGGDGAAAPGP